MIEVRTNDQWIVELRTIGQAQDAALADLRVILKNGLQRGLVSQVDTNAPEFDTLADDFVQEALLKILDNLDSFAGRSRFTTWAHKITVNVGLTELRRKRWKDSSLEQLTESDEGDYTPSFTADDAPTPEDTTERSEMMAYVARIIDEELTEKQRTAVTAAILEGQPLSEVAHMMESNQNALYKLIFDARQRLKRRLEADGYSPESLIATFEQ